jgi:hypothetical protein
MARLEASVVSDRIGSRHWVENAQSDPETLGWDFTEASRGLVRREGPGDAERKPRFVFHHRSGLTPSLRFGLMPLLNDPLQWRRLNALQPCFALLRSKPLSPGAVISAAFIFF